MKYVVLFPNTADDMVSKVCVVSSDVEADTAQEAVEMCAHSVPKGWPIAVYAKEDYDIKFHHAYSPDWETEKVGEGTNEKMRTSFLAIGFNENW